MHRPAQPSGPRSTPAPFSVIAAPAGAFLAVAAAVVAVQPEGRPALPPVVTPAVAHQQAPSDAVVLFNGRDLSNWRKEGGGAAAWNVADGVITIAPGSGSIITEETFGDAQIHIEFALPEDPAANGQDRGNSGVYIHGLYEVQVLDSYENETYPDGQCGAIYGQHPPLVNASLPPGRWQSYDIIFRAPRFDAQGNRSEPARLTVLHNGVLVQNNVEVIAKHPAGGFKEEPGERPLYLQDHGNPVRYRNIWVRRLD